MNRASRLMIIAAAIGGLSGAFVGLPRQQKADTRPIELDRARIEAAEAKRARRAARNKRVKGDE